MQTAPPELQRLDAIEARLAQLERRMQGAPAPGDGLATRFHALTAEWRAGRGHTSSIQAMAMHPAYQQIIGMGDRVVPLLLAEMREHPGHWSWALRAITGENPVPPEARGNVEQISAAWIEWGRQRGYIS